MLSSDVAGGADSPTTGVLQRSPFCVMHNIDSGVIKAACEWAKLMTKLKSTDEVGNSVASSEKASLFDRCTRFTYYSDGVTLRRNGFPGGVLSLGFGNAHDWPVIAGMLLIVLAMPQNLRETTFIPDANTCRAVVKALGTLLRIHALTRRKAMTTRDCVALERLARR